MKNKILSIDFEIIWKSIHDSLDESEQCLLDRWLAEDPKHKAYYEQAEQYFLHGKTELIEPDIQSFWENNELVEGKSKRWLLVSVAASIVLVIAALFFTPRLTRDNIQETVAENTDQSLRPGEKKAVLHLGNGKKVTLGSGKKFQTDANGTLIEATDESVRYSKSGASFETHTIEVPIGGEFMLVLSDSTKVWMNSASTLTYPSHFSGNERVVHLTGEAYFEVTHRKKQPFDVVTGDQRITVLGTSFNVNSYPEEKEIVSTLLEGKVSVSTESGASALLSPGEQAVFDKQGKVISKKEVNAENFIAWKNGLFYFEDESLEQIMTVLARWYDIQVVYGRSELKDIQFTGTLKRYDNFKDVIELIELTDDIEFKIKEKEVFID